MTILVVAAHPDDEVLGCGGMIARSAAEGHEVHIAILGEGISSRHDAREDADPEAMVQLRDDAQRAARQMGARSVVFGGFADNRFDEGALLDVVKVVERWVADYRPDTIYTHHPGDLNVDHGVTFRAVLTATRPVAGHLSVPDLYTFEVPSSTEWAFQRIEPVFRPNVFEDIASTLDQKIAAMECYQSERRTAPHPRSPEVLRAAAARWGSIAGMTAAEPFELIRSLRRGRH
jgi:LmbE family N-acetylglucosaminyl deacetylase